MADESLQNSGGMSGTLPGLPAELLLKIAECCHSYEQRDQFERLRATSKAINEKLILFYGQRWYKHVNGELSKESLTGVVAISQGQLAFHMESIEISCDTLMVESEMRISSESSDADEDPWYDDRESDDKFVYKFGFDENKFSALMEGTCAKLLGTAIPRFTNLKRPTIAQPYVRQGIKRGMLEALQWRWTFAVKVIFSTVLSKAIPLQSLLLEHPGIRVPVHASILEHLGIYVSQLTALNNFCLNIMGTDVTYEKDQYVRILVHILQHAPCLRELGLGFGDCVSNQMFFKSLTKLEPKLNLRRLQLYQLRTRKKYLKMFLRLFKATIEALVLDYVSLESGANMAGFLHTEMNLKEVTLRCLNAGETGIRFDKISLQRPKYGDTWTEPGWLCVRQDIHTPHKVVLSQEEGDDVKHWLRKVEELAAFGYPWPWDYE